MNDCKHETFEASVNVGRLTDGDDGPVTSYVAEIKIVCAICRVEFGFLGPAAGVRNDEPTTSMDGLELRCPIVPGSVPRRGPCRYDFPGKPVRHA
jgi:hypothetical protein